MTSKLPTSIDETVTLLRSTGYIAGRDLATVVFLSLKMGRPLFLEGEAGVGKTEIAKVLAETLDRKLVRLQCYEGLDIASAVYEWNYARQMIEIRLAEAAHAGGSGEGSKEKIAADIFSERFLIKRPLLQALEADPKGPPVLLIDELDRTDEPFEAFLLEILSDFQVSIPELGTVRAPELSAALGEQIVRFVQKLRASDLFKLPGVAETLDWAQAILAARAPEVPAQLAAQIVAFVHKLRATDLFKLPGVAETLDWGQALVALGCVELDPATVDATLGVLLKYQDDLTRITGPTARALVDAARSAG